MREAEEVLVNPEGLWLKLSYLVSRIFRALFCADCCLTVDLCFTRACLWSLSWIPPHLEFEAALFSASFFECEFI